MIPKIDSHIGILAYSTDFEGVGGTIKNTPEDFEVTELLSKEFLGLVGRGPGHPVYVLEKKNIDTMHAIQAIQKKNGMRLRSLGLKDASAVTRQYVCSAKGSRSVESLDGPKFALRRVGFAKRPLSKSDMVGNHFKIRISGLGGGLEGFAGQDRVLNFYGYQRFGSRRPVTHLVGRALVRRDFAGAVDLILSYASEYDRPENSELRKRLSDAASYKECLGMLPPRMDIEVAVLEQMASHGDPLRAMRAVPVQMRRFYVQAYQSYLFNRTLSEALAAGEDLFGPRQDDVCFDHTGTITKHVAGRDMAPAAPLVGYAYYKKTRFDRYVQDLLESEGILPKDFFIKDLQEASSQGGFRQGVMRCTGYAARGDMVEFALSRGSFATILLREIIKPEDPLAAGF